MGLGRRDGDIVRVIYEATREQIFELGVFGEQLKQQYSVELFEVAKFHSILNSTCFESLLNITLGWVATF